MGSSKSRRLAAAVIFGTASLTACADGSEPSTSELDVEVTIASLNAFWEQNEELLGIDFEAVPLNRVSTGADGVTCNNRPLEVEEVEGNALVDGDCTEGILVAYDPAYLNASNARLEATLAHEWGHVLQAQGEEIDLSLSPTGLEIDAELQADCFGGAWAAENATSSLDQLRNDVESAGDPHSVPVDDADAHGTGTERVAAHEIGVEFGPTGCIEQIIDVLPG